MRVTPRKGRVSRNVPNLFIFQIILVTPRKGRVSRNAHPAGAGHGLNLSRLARGV